MNFAAIIGKMKEISGAITASAAAFAVIGGVIYSTGWIVTRSAAKADAQEVAQQKANEVYKELLVVQQNIYDELKKDDEARLQQDIQILALQIEGLESNPDRSDYENTNLRILHTQLELKQGELSKMLEAKAAP
jgi:hypothetical protein